MNLVVVVVVSRSSGPSKSKSSAVCSGSSRHQGPAKTPCRLQIQVRKYAMQSASHRLVNSANQPGKTQRWLEGIKVEAGAEQKKNTG
jgi:hypothetical protein